MAAFYEQLKKIEETLIKEGHHIEIDTEHFLKSNYEKIAQVGTQFLNRTWAATEDELALVEKEIRDHITAWKAKAGEVVENVEKDVGKKTKAKDADVAKEKEVVQTAETVAKDADVAKEKEVVQTAETVAKDAEKVATAMTTDNTGGNGL
jgi:hypothetical protein